MRPRLAMLVAAAMALVLAGFLVPLAVLIRSVAADRAVTGATSEAQSLAPLVATTDRASLRLVVDQLVATSHHKITIFLPDGAVIGVDAPRTPGVRLAARGRSISVRTGQGREILVAVQGLRDGTAVIRTFVGRAELRRGVCRAWLILVVLGAVLLALGVVVADALARSLVRPIGELAQVSNRLAAGELQARAVLAGPPEVREVASALNHLAGRIRELIRQEREAVADMSHRLRTPLTALRLEAESSQPLRPARIRGQIEALERAVTGLIEDARRVEEHAGTCDAARVVAERAAFWTALAEDQDRAMRLDLAAGPLPVRVSGPDLAACLDALLGNVFAHTPVGTRFAVVLAPRGRGGGAVVSVEDAGPGFGPPDTLRRGCSGGGSTGLGLDIARQTAEASAGRLTIGRSAAMGGARIAVEFGPPTPQPLGAH